MKDGIYMTDKEKNRADLFSKINQKKIPQAEAVKQLGLSVRHVQRLYAAAYRRNRSAVLVSKKRGHCSNHQLPSFIKARVRELVTCEKYSGFGLPFIHEKFEQLHGMTVSQETTRQLMIKAKYGQQKR